MLKAFTNLLGVVHGFGFAWGNQCGGEKRFAVQRQKLEQGFVFWYPQTYGFTLRMAYTPRDFFSSL